MILSSKRYYPDDKYIQSRLDNTGTKIHYDEVNINGASLTRVIVIPDKALGVQLFYQGHAVSICKNSTLKSIVQQAEGAKQVMIAFDQRGVGSSSGALLAHEKLFQKDLDQQVSHTKMLLHTMIVQKKVPDDAKWSIYGLCFGGLLAINAAAKYQFDRTFSHAVFSRSTRSLSHMLGWSCDLSYYFPAIFANPNDSRVEKTNVKESYAVRLRKGSFRYFVLSVQAIPRNLRFAIFRVLLSFFGWNLHVIHSADAKKFLNSNKVKVLKINDDEFISSRACLSNEAHNNTVVMQYFSPDTDKVKQFYYDRYKDSPSAKVYKNANDYFDNVVDERGSVKHQAWSPWLWVQDKQGSWKNELDVCSDPSTLGR